MIQEIFGFHKEEKLDWNDFIESEENREAISCLLRWPSWNSNGVIIYGDSGVGKTHIANLWAQSSNAVCVLKSSVDYDARFLFDTECNFLFDDFDDFLSTQNYNWIFDFFNIAKEKHRFFLLLSRKNPSIWTVPLDDLRSRLMTLPSVLIKNPGDELLLKIAKKISTDLCTEISEDSLNYILNHVDRGVASIIKTLQILDKLSMQQQKAITIPFIKHYLCNNQ